MMINCTGVGIGPANLSLACQLSSERVSAQFFDKRPDFSWHEGMQIENATLQVSLFKDLVTLADPTSPYTFLNYLHEMGRLSSFINAGFDAVSRREFSNYMAWVTSRLNSLQFGVDVAEVDFDGQFKITTDRGVSHSENIVMGIGKVAKLPACVTDSADETLFHSSDYMWRKPKTGNKRITIVGGGQSGAEIFLDCISRQDDEKPAHVSWVSSRSNYWPIDDSPFTNDMFLPCYVDYFEKLSKEERGEKIASDILTSDGVSESTLRAIYQKLYHRRFVEGEEDFANLLPNRRLRAAASETGGWKLLVHHKQEAVEEVFQADIVIFATGYNNATLPLSKSLKDRLEWEDQEISIGQDYAARWNGPTTNRIFIQNGAAKQKGLADPNLSLLAWRSRKIADSILGRTDTIIEAQSLIEWRSTLNRQDMLQTA